MLSDCKRWRVGRLQPASLSISQVSVPQRDLLYPTGSYPHGKEKGDDGRALRNIAQKKSLAGEAQDE